MAIDPSILDEAGIIAYDEDLSVAERRAQLLDLYESRPELRASISGYLEQLSILDNPLPDGE